MELFFEINCARATRCSRKSQANKQRRTWTFNLKFIVCHWKCARIKIWRNIKPCSLYLKYRIQMQYVRPNFWPFWNDGITAHCSKWILYTVEWSVVESTRIYQQFVHFQPCNTYVHMTVSCKTVTLNTGHSKLFSTHLQNNRPIFGIPFTKLTVNA